MATLQLGNAPSFLLPLPPGIRKTGTMKGKDKFCLDGCLLTLLHGSLAQNTRRTDQIWRTAMDMHPLMSRSQHHVLLNPQRFILPLVPSPKSSLTSTEVLCPCTCIKCRILLAAASIRKGAVSTAPLLWCALPAGWWPHHQPLGVKHGWAYFH